MAVAPVSHVAFSGPRTNGGAAPGTGPHSVAPQNQTRNESERARLDSGHPRAVAGRTAGETRKSWAGDTHAVGDRPPRHGYTADRGGPRGRRTTRTAGRPRRYVRAVEPRRAS